MEMTFQDALMAIADAYAEAVTTYGGKSLARVATIVVNRGSFFERLRDGAGFSVQNLDRMLDYFRTSENWPNGIIPAQAATALAGVGRPVVRMDDEVAHETGPTAPANTTSCGKSGDVAAQERVA